VTPEFMVRIAGNVTLIARIVVVIAGAAVVTSGFVVGIAGAGVETARIVAAIAGAGVVTAGFVVGNLGLQELYQLLYTDKCIWNNLFSAKV
jgi:hypothetical protein